MVDLEKPVRIVYFSDATWAGGAERYLYLLASNLSRGAFEPIAVLNRSLGLVELEESLKGAGVPVHWVSLNLPRSPSGVTGFISLLRRLRPALLHCNLPGPWASQYSLVAPLARLAGVRHVVSTEHLPMVPPFAKGKLFKGFGSLWIERVMTVSEDNVGYLVGSYGIPRGKIRVVRIGTPPPAAAPRERVRSELGVAEEDFICLMVGSLEERKGHGRALDALGELDGRIKLFIAGRGEREADYRAKVSSLGLDGRVRFLGYRTDVGALLAACDVLLCPSTLEATPYVILEAMAAGVPVVASRIYGIPEIVVDGFTGILIDPASRGDLIQALAALSRDGALRARMGEAGRKRWEETFRIERCVAGTEAVYRELVSTSSNNRM
ncbi:MAG TPA: glycosyltransferase family 4 protein [Candidatus Bathyarchaeia archaeon]|nr:glycosyltransferase family 4 protein [Candidatus Bathyarchaeia archaeon]